MRVEHLRPEEQWAAACLEQALPGIVVAAHDDGSRAGMHDLDLVRNGERFGACEVTAAVDPASTELWRLVNERAERCIEPGTSGGWSVRLDPRCRATRLKAQLRPLIVALESAGVSHLGDTRGHGTHDLEEWAERLGIASMSQGPTAFPGSVYPTIELPSERSGGMVPPTGDGLADWLSEWTAKSDQRHNLEKLVASGASERHLFVLVPGFSTAPFEVVDLLMTEDGREVTVPPQLPAALTHVWAASTWNIGLVHGWSSAGGWVCHPKPD